MRYAPEEEEEPKSIRRLRQMVMALLVVLMLGILAIAGTIVIRLGLGAGSGGPVVADQFTLPDGEVTGIGQGEGTVLFMVRAADGTERLYTFDADAGGAPLSTTVITRK